MKYWIALVVVIVLTSAFAEIAARIIGGSTLAAALSVTFAVLFVLALVLIQWRVDKRRRSDRR
jgi:uncharacterized membrane protein YqjE